EPLFTLGSARRGLRSPGHDDVILTDGSGTVIPATLLSFDPLSNIFTASFTDLSESDYELRFVSGDEAFEDVLGNDMDGEPVGPGVDGTPSGDGLQGGDYVVHFAVGATT